VLSALLDHDLILLGCGLTSGEKGFHPGEKVLPLRCWFSCRSLLFSLYNGWLNLWFYNSDRCVQAIPQCQQASVRGIYA
jgi:hypothetical protein